MGRPAAPWRIKGKKVYRGYSQAELDAQYDVAEPPGEKRDRERQWVADENARVRAAHDCRLDVPYGAGAAERLDIFPARKPGAPVAVFIHGGYWKQFSKEDESLYADLFVPAGAAYVSVDYALAPGATLDEIVRQCRAATAWVAKNAAGFNGDPTRIHLIGRSAGAHLAAMVLASDWPSLGLARSPVAGATLISGLYDLEPILLAFTNEWTRLDRATAFRLSPQFHFLDAPVPLIVAWGGAETAEFIRQSQDYAVAAQARGFPCTTIEIPGARHSGSRLVLYDRASALTRAVLAQAGL
jgi:arylformamidase